MRIVNDTIGNGNGTEPNNGCVCASGWKSTRGSSPPWFSCHCNCIAGNKKNRKANYTKADVK